MKTNNTYYNCFCKIITFLPIYIFSLLLLSCNSDNVSDLQLFGDCLVDTITLDNYVGTVDLKSRTITVRLPEEYSTNHIKVTSLQLSAGATCDIQEGDILNMSAPKVLHVKNGDLLMTKDGTVGKMAYIQNLPEEASL